MDPNLVYELIMDYNDNPQRYNDEEAETIATLANAMGTDFRRESKALSKGLFDLVDTAAFGMVPNEWRPRSAGQDIYGETGWDKFAGGVGTVAGLATGVGGAIKGATALKGSMSGGGKIATAVANAKKSAAAQRAKDLARNVYNKGDNILDYLNPMRDVSFKNLNLMP